MWRPALPLSRRLFGLLVLITAAPLVLVAVILVALLVPEGRRGVEHHNADLAAAITTQIEAQLASRRFEMEQLAHEVTELDDAAVSRTGLLDSALRANSRLDALYVTEVEGRIAAAAVRPETRLHVRDLIGIDMSARPFFIEATSTGQAIWSDTFLSMLSGRVTTALVLPAGPRWLLAEWSLDGLSQIVSDFSDHQDLLIVIVDRKGRVIGHPRASVAAQQQNIGNLGLVRQALGGVSATGELRLQGEAYLASVRPVPSSGWSVVVAQPRRVVDAPLWKIGGSIAAGLAAALLLAVGVAWAIARYVERRSRAVLDGAQRLVRGEAVPPLVSGVPEIRQLWQALESLFIDLRRRDSQAQAARRELQAVLDAATEVAIVASDLDGTIRVFNEGAVRMLGYEPGAVIGHANVDLIHDPREFERRRERLSRGMGRMLEPREVYERCAVGSANERRDWTFVRRDGSKVEVALTMDLLRDADGRPTGMLRVAVDQSERRRLIDLELARRKAETLSQAKSEFLSRVSHELRTPLNAMLGFTELLELDRREPLGGVQRVRVQHMQRAGRHLLQLIEELLDLSRIEAGTIRLDLQPVDLNAAAQEATDLVAPLLRDTGVALTVAPLPQRLAVLADATRLTQVLVNLLGNAIKYNRPGGTVRLELHQLVDQVSVQVVDSGRGMTTAQLGQLFEPFNRLGRERGDVDGTGIGLVITRGLVRLMGGRLEVDSRVGVGSRFSFSLPVVALPAEMPITTPDPVRGDAAATAPPAAAGDVLYVEDNEVNVLLMQQFLAQRPGVRLHVANLIREGYPMARSLRPAAILLDLHLPDGSGLDLLTQLRDDPLLRHVPVVIVSADATDVQRQRLHEQGVFAYLTKPLQVESVLACLDAAVQSTEDAVS